MFCSLVGGYELERWRRRGVKKRSTNDLHVQREEVQRTLFLSGDDILVGGMKQDLGGDPSISTDRDYCKHLTNAFLSTGR